jgi:hypothetical protein
MKMTIYRYLDVAAEALSGDRASGIMPFALRQALYQFFADVAQTAEQRTCNA